MPSNTTCLTVLLLFNRGWYRNCYNSITLKAITRCPCLMRANIIWCKFHERHFSSTDTVPQSPFLCICARSSYCISTCIRVWGVFSLTILFRMSRCESLNLSVASFVYLHPNLMISNRLKMPHSSSIIVISDSLLIAPRASRVVWTISFTGESVM